MFWKLVFSTPGSDLNCTLGNPLPSHQLLMNQLYLIALFSMYLYDVLKLFCPDNEHLIALCFSSFPMANVADCLPFAFNSGAAIPFNRVFSP